MTSSQFFISVIIPVYNGDVFLAEAVDSIKRQDHQSLEIIIVDDGSTDRTAQVAAGFNGEVRYVYQANSGPPAARNNGLKMARGNVIGFLDADDLWAANKLEVQLARLSDSPAVEIVLGRTQRVKSIREVSGKSTFAMLSDPTVSLSLGSAIFRTSVFAKVGFLDETLYHCDDWDWFIRARELGVVMEIHQEVTQFYRRHDNNVTNHTERGRYYTFLMLKKSLYRRHEQHRNQ